MGIFLGGNFPGGSFHVAKNVNPRKSLNLDPSVSFRYYGDEIADEIGLS